MTGRARPAGPGTLSCTAHVGVRHAFALDGAELNLFCRDDQRGQTARPDARLEAKRCHGLIQRYPESGFARMDGCRLENGSPQFRNRRPPMRPQTTDPNIFDVRRLWLGRLGVEQLKDFPALPTFKRPGGPAPRCDTGAWRSFTWSGRTIRKPPSATTAPARQKLLPIRVQSTRIISTADLCAIWYDGINLNSWSPQKQRKSWRMTSARLYSIGHSNHEMDRFLELLAGPA